jgi:prepilin-type N-terminal cleavage/methylation domain-containing protein
MNLPVLLKKKGFSLVEVVVAVGIFALAIVGVIGLLSPTNKAIADVTDSDNATRVVNAVQQGLQQLASSGRFTTVGSTVGVGASTTGATVSDGLIQATAPADPADGTTLATSSTYSKFTLYASRDGTKVGLTGDTTVWGSAAATDHTQKYFEIMLIRNSTLSPNLTAANADTASGYLAYTMRIRWPAYTPDGNEFKIHTQKSVLIVPGAITR